jgi:hypothetical protein
VDEDVDKGTDGSALECESGSSSAITANFLCRSNETSVISLRFGPKRGGEIKLGNNVDKSATTSRC